MELCLMLRGNLDDWDVWEKTDTCICIAESLQGQPETITLLIDYTPAQSKMFKRKNKGKEEKIGKSEDEDVLGHPS